MANPLQGCDFRGADISGLRINGQQATWQMLHGFGCQVDGAALALEKAGLEGRAFGQGLAPSAPEANTPLAYAQAAATLRESGICNAQPCSVADTGRLSAPDTPAGPPRGEEIGRIC